LCADDQHSNVPPVPIDNTADEEQNIGPRIPPVLIDDARNEEQAGPSDIFNRPNVNGI